MTRIIAAIDFSRSSLAAARLAGHLCRKWDAELELVNVAVPITTGVVVGEPIVVPHPITAKLESDRSIEADRQLEALAKTIAAEFEIDVSATARFGSVLDELSTFDRDAALFVVGNEGKGMIASGLATRLARTANTPVLVCPVDCEAPLSRAVAAVELSDSALTLTAAASSLLELGGLIELFHLHPSIVLDVSGMSDDAETLAVIAAADDSGIKLRGYVAHGALGPALLERASDIDADLVAIGVEPSEAEAAIGLAERIVSNAPLPLLLVPVPAVPVEANLEQPPPAAGRDGGNADRSRD